METNLILLVFFIPFSFTVNVGIQEDHGFVEHELGPALITTGKKDYSCQRTTMALFDNDIKLQMELNELITGYCKDISKHSLRRTKRAVVIPLIIMGGAIAVDFIWNYFQFSNLKEQMETMEKQIKLQEESLSNFERILIKHDYTMKMGEYRTAVFDLMYRGKLSGFILDTSILSPVILQNAGLVNASNIEIADRLSVIVDNCDGTILHLDICYEQTKVVQKGVLTQVGHIGAFDKNKKYFHHYEDSYFVKSETGSYKEVDLEDCMLEGRQFHCRENKNLTCEVPSGNGCKLETVEVTNDFTLTREIGETNMVATNAKFYTVRTRNSKDKVPVPPAGTFSLKMNIKEQAVVGRTTIQGLHDGTTHIINLHAKALADSPEFKKMTELAQKRKDNMDAMEAWHYSFLNMFLSNPTVALILAVIVVVNTMLIVVCCYSKCKQAKRIIKVPEIV